MKVTGLHSHDYKTKPDGEDMTEADAFKMSREIDRSKKPGRPGKRAMPGPSTNAQTPPATPTKSAKTS